MTNPAATVQSVTESRFNALKAKLRELFELDKSDLDFRIYRIINARNKEITEFLDRQLRDVVRETLAEHGAGEAAGVQAELDKAVAQARELGVDPDASEKVKSLRGRLEAAGGGPGGGGDIEADIYNHLHAFFSRYYEEGDFISKRRYKGDTYAIPYSGEEVTLHWANKDQYYIKSGEWHKDYRFKVGDKTVRFKLVEASQEVGNNKERDDAKRRYILDADIPIESTANELTLRFQFRPPTEAEKTRAADGAVGIWGGGFAKGTKGEEREQFCADAEKRALAAMPEEWKRRITAAAATDAKPARTLLGKHLDHFTARNTFDYFIHKDLGGFLRRELDFYIKNEVVRLDDLDTAPPDHLRRVQGRVKAVRRVAGRIIDLLASIEDFQKKIWLKKKFVLSTNWLVTIDRVPPALRDVVAANRAQWEEWERLGFKPEKSGEGLFGGAEWGTRGYLDACDKLVVDTRLFESSFVPRMLSELLVSPRDRTIDAATTCVLVNAENQQAIAMLNACFHGRIQCIYIDPPYNTGNDGFLYKDNYSESSWLALMWPRLQAGKNLLARSGVAMVSIDDAELSAMGFLGSEVFGDDRCIANIVWKRRSTPPNDKVLGTQHEYIQVFANDPACMSLNLRPRGEERLAKYQNPDNHPKGPWVYGDLQANVKGGRYVSSLSFPIVNPSTGEQYLPKNKGNWRFNSDKIKRLIEANEIAFGTDGRGFPKLKRFLCDVKDGITYTTWWDFVPMNAVGTEELDALLGVSSPLENPKPTGLVSELCLLGAGANDWIMDFFAGSGSTGHAVLRINRENDRACKSLLVEVGAHFRDIILPRIAKVTYSPSWKDGRALLHDKGLSALIKHFALESYEDGLNNLPAPSGDLLAGRDAAEEDALITYALDLELGPHLLNLDAFRDPWGYSINAQLAGDEEMRRQRVDLVETFNYLIGLKVHAYGPMERYGAEFEKTAHADDLGRLKVKGRLRRDAEGPFLFQRVEGELNDGAATRVLVVWRKLTDNPEQDAAVLEAWMERHRENTKERSEHRDYQMIYINGPVTLPQPTQDIRTVFPTEETFKQRMFEDTDGAGG